METLDANPALPPHPPSPRKQLKNTERFRAKHMRGRTRRVGYLRQHWRGDLPLAVAVIVSAALVWGVVQLIGYASRQVPITDYPVGSSLLWLLEVTILIAGALWWGTGVQRSAIESVDRGGSMPVAVLTGIVGIGAFVWVGVFWFQSARYVMPEVWSTLIGSSPPATVHLEARSGQVVVQGGLEFGSTRAVRAVLDDNPNVRIVRLDSRGGRVAEGLALGTLLRDRNLDTYVNDECSSACVTAFAGGARRIIGTGARLGLHSAGGAGFSADAVASANRRSDDFIAARGVDQRVLQQGASIANDQIWFPSHQVLLNSGLATELIGR
ncbi:MAG TPA: hypothetical protein VNQ74_00800 [Burkholderiaceae bacterium]|nr:hypothetical protein [Burkholderiaceae bacterium]